MAALAGTYWHWKPQWKGVETEADNIDARSDQARQELLWAQTGSDACHQASQDPPRKRKPRKKKDWRERWLGRPARPSQGATRQWIGQ